MNGKMDDTQWTQLQMTRAQGALVSDAGPLARDVRTQASLATVIRGGATWEQAAAAAAIGTSIRPQIVPSNAQELRSLDPRHEQWSPMQHEITPRARTLAKLACMVLALLVIIGCAQSGQPAKHHTDLTRASANS